MTLKEKFDIISCKMIPDCELNKIEQISDDYAIEFAEWLLKKYDGIKSTKQLLEIFKKEKGL